MANQVYPKAKEGMLTGDIDVIAGTVKIQMFDSDVYYDPALEFFDEMPGTAVGAAVTITAKDITDGRFTGAIGSFTPPNGFVVIALVVFIDTGTPATSRLLAYIDTKGDTIPITITTNGSAMLLHWNDPFFSIGG
jgi:hypothetical protein